MLSFPVRTLWAAKAVTPRPANPAIWVLGSLKFTAGAPGKNLVCWGSGRVRLGQGGFSGVRR